MGSIDYIVIAAGRSRQVELELDRSDDVAADHFLTMRWDQLEFRVNVDGFDVARRLEAFVRTHHGHCQHAHIRIGTIGALELLLIKDNEHADRFFLRTSGDGKGMIDVVLVDPIAVDFGNAMSDLAAALEAT